MNFFQDTISIFKRPPALTGGRLISVMYLASRDELYREINKFTTLYYNDGIYLVAGPKEMVDATSDYLQNNNISKKNIIKDSFLGIS
ncbi:hypothetical protein M948_21070 [Virgibacillus sp. CM-4]|uniref:hypothetical protein n=1 Tax=Virgibacillus sp. CM-4 TaxID=1354277 RepID=UPI0003882C5A|nr:hypothetical protein [Virgibacillus sp. CM-4]EQB34555.1 hypothetical protein M948_21070 [Virgibacillus sp. CM-4]